MAIIDIIKTLEDQILSITSTKDSLYTKLYNIAKVIIPQVENIGKDWSGEDKKKLAMDIINDVLDRYVHTWIPRWIINLLISHIIDAVVAYFNKTGIFMHK